MPTRFYHTSTISVNVQEFLSLLTYENRYLSFSIGDPDYTANWMFYKSEELPSDFPQDRNVYFAPAFRKAKGNKKVNVAGSIACWVDIDHTDLLPPLALPASIIIRSGHGYHLYYLLTEPLFNTTRLEQINKRLSRALGEDVDRGVWNCNRFLRVPRTNNCKDPANPIPVEVIEFRPHLKYTPEELELLPEIPERIAKLIHTGNKEKSHKSRSERDQAVVNALVAQGARDQLIYKIFNYAAVGDRHREEEGDRYLEITIASAREYVGGEEYKQMQLGNDIDRYFTEKGRFLPAILADDLHAIYHFLYVPGILYRYTNGVFRPDGEEVVRKAIQDILGRVWQPVHSDAVVKWIKQHSAIEPDEINQHAGLVNIKDGMLDLRTREVLTHSPDYRSTIQLPIEYMPDADPSFVDRFLLQIIPEDAVPIFWEALGSAFLTQQYWPKAYFLLKGENDSGKSKVLEWITWLFGNEQSVANISFHDLADNRFSKQYLYGKMLNIFSDLDESEIQSKGTIKSLTGDDRIFADIKGAKGFFFKNTARLWFSANQYPSVRGPDKAFFRRAYVFKCENTFVEGVNADPFIVSKLITPPNMAAALNRMIEGYQRLVAQNYAFSSSASMSKARIDYQETIDSVAAWLADDTIESYEGYMVKEEMYAKYTRWCFKRKRMPQPHRKFYDRVQELAKDGYAMVEKYPLVKEYGIQKWVWTGRVFKGI